MRKSERLRELEIAVVRMEMTLELIQMTLAHILESEGLDRSPNLDQGKWYREKPKDY